MVGTIALSAARARLGRSLAPQLSQYIVSFVTKQSKFLAVSKVDLRYRFSDNFITKNLADAAVTRLSHRLLLLTILHLVFGNVRLIYLLAANQNGFHYV